jgi:REP element-mobilizing transposase RayT
MVIAYHLIATAYGWWLPNDLRGSMSRSIASDVIAELGELHYGRKTVQPASHEIRAFYEEAVGLLQHELLEFDRTCRDCIAEAFAECIRINKYTCYACAIMRDHDHLVIRKHKHLAEEMIYQFQKFSADLLKDRGLCPANHPVWGGPGWKVFLDTPEDIRRTIPYVQRNPIKAHMPAQHHSFVASYDDWPLHPGHNPNSPFARAIRETRASIG